MIKNYGLISYSGNDLNWDEVVLLESFNADLELAIFNGDVELDEDGFVPDEIYEGFSDSNPTIIYYKSGEDQLNIQQILKDGKKLDEFVDWFISHDTNGNHVSVVGEVPDEYFTEECNKERNDNEL